MGMRSIQELVDGLSRIAAASFTHQRVLQETRNRSTHTCSSVPLTTPAT